MFTKENYQIIITPNMATLVESDVANMLNEDAFVKHFHIIKDKRIKDIRRICSNRLKGFTIIVKEEGGKYSYQVATCGLKDLFSRRSGRYYAYLRAKLEGFIDVPEEAFKYCQDTPEAKEREVINYYIKTVVNKRPPYRISLPGLSVGVEPSEINQAFLDTFEGILMSILPEGLKVSYSHYRKTDVTEARLEPIDKTNDVLVEYVKTTPVAQVKRYVHDQQNKYVARYNALYKLFLILTEEM